MEIQSINIKKLAKYSVEEVFRANTDAPGFVLLDFGKSLSSYKLREIMVNLKKELSSFTISEYNKKLSYHWLVRFDQQEDTPFHVDNAAEESFLMLGYEPSEIASELYIADYHKFATNNEFAPTDYLRNFTPVYQEDESLLRPFSTKIASFHKDTYKIVLINNSKPKPVANTLGVFHKAKIVRKDLKKSRIVNSMIINMLPANKIIDNEPDEEEFLKTALISK
ncbi:hypothetical protein [Cellulophaga baltica]|uniref:hypothetical protein n=1 Tax=Cellulophaga baltica TaxID=76594 RepID=UPI0004058602|nr:hypothetical protein [Cellulophaga baltica]MBA6316055.1 hypothetical protein [Cellulophaga baltica]